MLKKIKISLLQIIAITLIVLIFIGLEIITYLSSYEIVRVFRPILKALIFALSLSICMPNVLRNKSKEGYILLSAVISFGISDVLINLSMITGGIFAAVGHILLLIAFIMMKKLSKIEIIIASILWLVLSGLAFGCYPLFVGSQGNLAIYFSIIFSVYYIIISLMVSSSFRNNSYLTIGAILYAVSDVHLMINTSLGSKFIASNIIALAIYYIAIIFIDLGTAIYNTKELG